MKTIGYSAFDCPADGVGPFKQLFNKGVNLTGAHSLKGIDAILLWGGADISPSLYAEKGIPSTPSKRDIFEFDLCVEAHKKGIPIIGVCRGAQFICAFAGGKLVQDCSGHGVGHDIVTSDGLEFNVTSSHHQMLYPNDVNHELLAWSKHKMSRHYHGLAEGDVVEKEPEVVYFPDINGFACQSHPEWQKDNHPFVQWLLPKINEYCFNTVEA